MKKNMIIGFIVFWAITIGMLVVDHLHKYQYYNFTYPEYLVMGTLSASFAILYLEIQDVKQSLETSERRTES